MGVADTGKHTPVAVKPLRALRGVVSATISGNISVERRQAKLAVADRVTEETG